MEILIYFLVLGFVLHGLTDTTYHYCKYFPLVVRATNYGLK